MAECGWRVGLKVSSQADSSLTRGNNYVILYEPLANCVTGEVFRHSGRLSASLCANAYGQLYTRYPPGTSNEYSSVPVVVMRSGKQAEQKKRQLYIEAFRSAI